MNSEAHHRSEAVALLNAARSTITIGTTVTLKSGGPAMVVTGEQPGSVYCTWHKDDGDLLRDWIPLVAVKVKP